MKWLSIYIYIYICIYIYIHIHKYICIYSCIISVILLILQILVDEVAVSKVVPPTLKRPFRCLNSDCRSEKDLVRADKYIRRFFGVLSYPK